jgi:acyl-coenzyme A synthetase/AMP-(fatty) acid ligase
LASYKKPTRVFFVDALPRNASMKVQKRVLRAMFEGTTDVHDVSSANRR